MAKDFFQWTFKNFNLLILLLFGNFEVKCAQKNQKRNNAYYKCVRFKFEIHFCLGILE
jgi:hypothetical protein